MDAKKITIKNGQLRAKIWIEDGDGQKICGRGPIELLEHINQLGSIQKATEAMEMSYKKALGLIQVLNKQCAAPVLETSKGGSSRGGTTITPTGLELIKNYRALENQFQDHVQQLEKTFLP